MINRFLLASFSCLSNIPIEIVLWLSQISTKHIHININYWYWFFNIFGFQQKHEKVLEAEKKVDKYRGETCICLSNVLFLPF